MGSEAIKIETGPNYAGHRIIVGKLEYYCISGSWFRKNTDYPNIYPYHIEVAPFKIIELLFGP